jgi:hypothetical protein
MTSRAIVSLGAAAALVVACSGSSGSGNSGGGGGGGGAGGGGSGAQGAPCTLLTQAQVAAALGVQVNAGVPSDNAPFHYCMWVNVNQGPGNTSGIYGFTLVAVDGAVDFAAQCNGPPGPNETIVPVSGVGDAACYDELTNVGVDLRFEKGTSSYTSEVNPAGTFTGPPSTIEPQEKTLALEALANL